MAKQPMRKAAAALAIGLVVAACSGGSDGGTSADSADSLVDTSEVEPLDVAEPTDEAEPEAESAAGVGTDDETEPDSGDAGEADSEAVEPEPGPEPEPDPDPEPESEDEAAPKARWETGESDYLFDQSLLHTYELTISEENLAFLDADPAAEEYVEGSLTFEGETLETVGIRYKGSIGSFLACTDGPNPFQPSGRKTCDKLSMKIKINWNDKTEFYGLRRVQLHAMNLDSTLMHDRLGYWMFEQAGVAGPRSTHARLMINGEFAGLFAMTEQIDGRLVRDRFDDGTGNVYKEVWPFDSNREIIAAEELIGGLETNEDEDPTADIMLEFAQAILDSGATTDPVVAREVLDEWTDLDAFIAYAVVDRAIAHDDGPFHWYCIQGPCEPHNFYWYEDPTERKLHLIPWDLDNAFDGLVGDGNPITKIADGWGETQNDCDPFPFGTFGLLQVSAACDPLVAAWSSLTDDYERIRAELFSGPATIDIITERLEAWAEQIAPVVAESEAAFDGSLTVAQWEQSVATLVTNLTSTLEI